jgi:hypothetical protein
MWPFRATLNFSIPAFVRTAYAPRLSSLLSYGLQNRIFPTAQQVCWFHCVSGYFVLPDPVFSTGYLRQMPRFIAIPLIGDVLDGLDSPAWLYPAILDVIVAASAPFVMYLLWSQRNLRDWVAGIVFLVVSILDHGGSVSADFLTETPKIYGGEEGPDPMIVSSAQGAIDILVLWLLTRANVRNYYLRE